MIDNDDLLKIILNYIDDIGVLKTLNKQYKFNSGNDDLTLLSMLMAINEIPDEKIINLIREEILNPSRRTDGVAYSTELHKAVSFGRKTLINYMVNRAKLYIHEPDSFGHHPIHRARSSIDMLRYMRSIGADINYKNNFLRQPFISTVFYEAIHTGKPDSYVNNLVFAGANILPILENVNNFYELSIYELSSFISNKGKPSFDDLSEEDKVYLQMRFL